MFIGIPKNNKTTPVISVIMDGNPNEFPIPCCWWWLTQPYVPLPSFSTKKTNTEYLKKRKLIHHIIVIRPRFTKNWI